MTKITVTTTDKDGKLKDEVCLTNGDELTADDLANMFAKIMLALGYGAENVNEIFNTSEFGFEDNDDGEWGN